MEENPQNVSPLNTVSQNSSPQTFGKKRFLIIGIIILVLVAVIVAIVLVRKQKRDAFIDSLLTEEEIQQKFDQLNQVEAEPLTEKEIQEKLETLPTFEESTPLSEDDIQEKLRELLQGQ